MGPNCISLTIGCKVKNCCRNIVVVVCLLLWSCLFYIFIVCWCTCFKQAPCIVDQKYLQKSSIGYRCEIRIGARTLCMNISVAVWFGTSHQRTSINIKKEVVLISFAYSRWLLVMFGNTSTSLSCTSLSECNGMEWAPIFVLVTRSRDIVAPNSSWLLLYFTGSSVTWSE